MSFGCTRIGVELASVRVEVGLSRPLILNKLNKKCITLVSLHCKTDNVCIYITLRRVRVTIVTVEKQ
jgi:hypothetical protein